MQIIAPCDPAECTEATRWCATQKNGPVYLRIGKAGEPNLTDKAVEPWVFGKLRYLKRGTDVCILSYGVITQMAMQLAERFEAKGKSVSVVSCHTLKPLDRRRHRRRARSATSRSSSSRSTRRRAASPRGPSRSPGTREATCRLDTFTLQDAFIHNYGSHDDLLGAHGLELAQIRGPVGLV